MKSEGYCEITSNTGERIKEKKKRADSFKI